MSLVEQYDKPGYSKRLFLFSDGCATYGSESAQALGELAAKFAEKSVFTTSFGIGSDFDEAVMKRIAEKGLSEFYYLQSASVIQPLVLKGLEGVMNTCTSKTRLVVRGVNQAVVTKIWGHADLVQGAQLGDLHYNNTRQVLAEISFPGHATGPMEVLSYELVYCLPENMDKELSISGKLSVTLTSDPIKEKPNHRVKVTHLIQQSGEIDEKVNGYVRTGDLPKAVESQKKSIKLLEEASKLEEGSGMATNMLKMARELLTSLEKRGITEESRQQYSHQSYMKRRCSVSYTDHYTFLSTE